MKGFVILIGILLLAGSFLGAKWVIDQQSPAVPTYTADADKSNEPPDHVFFLGYFDVESGVANVHPKQPGDIVMVANENQPVKAGELLLQIDDTLARLKVEQAEAAAAVAAKHVEEANLLEQLYKRQREEQEAAVHGVDYEIEKVSNDREVKLKVLGESNNAYKNLVDMYKASLAQLNQKKKAEQAKLEQVKLLNAPLKIALANAEWKLKKTFVNEAKEMLKHYKVIAPSNGMVLRVHVHKGETLGPNPRVHAIDFLPDSPIIVRAEILQEWARYVEHGQDVIIEDDTYNGPTWKGTVKSISRWYATTRSPVIEPFRYNDVRTLECIIEVKDDEAKKSIGQRIRAKIKIPKPKPQPSHPV